MKVQIFPLLLIVTQSERFSPLPSPLPPGEGHHKVAPLPRWERPGEGELIDDTALLPTRCGRIAKLRRRLSKEHDYLAEAHIIGFT
jgi:hypothetical protein